MAREGVGLFGVLDEGAEPVSPRDLAELRQVLEEWYRPMTDLGFRAFAAAIVRKRWGRRTLGLVLGAFLDHAYPNWAPRDFFALEPRLYGRAWYRQRIAEHQGNAERIGWYAVPGIAAPMFGWRHEIGELLPAYESRTPDGPVRADGTDGSDGKGGGEANDSADGAEIPAAVPPDVEVAKRLWRAEADLTDARRECARLRRELAQERAAMRRLLGGERLGLRDGEWEDARGCGDVEADDDTPVWPLPPDIDDADGANAAAYDGLFDGVRGQLVAVHRITINAALYAALHEVGGVAAERSRFVYGITYVVLPDQPERYVLWDVAERRIAWDASANDGHAAGHEDPADDET